MLVVGNGVSNSSCPWLLTQLIFLKGTDAKRFETQDKIDKGSQKLYHKQLYAETGSFSKQLRKCNLIEIRLYQRFATNK